MLKQRLIAVAIDNHQFALGLSEHATKHDKGVPLRAFGEENLPKGLFRSNKLAISDIPANALKRG
ncbi:hypothetical protein CS8_010740 [Cupriavidus sp. 8B]